MTNLLPSFNLELQKAFLLADGGTLTGEELTNFVQENDLTLTFSLAVMQQLDGPNYIVAYIPIKLYLQSGVMHTNLNYDYITIEPDTPFTLDKTMDVLEHLETRAREAKAFLSLN